MCVTIAAKTPSAKIIVSMSAYSITSERSSMLSIPRLGPDSFDWLSWVGGSIHDLGIPCRESCIIGFPGRDILRRYAIGFCEGEHLFCRPKPGTMAVLFVREEREFWFHLRKREFDIVFGVHDRVEEV